METIQNEIDGLMGRRKEIVGKITRVKDDQVNVRGKMMSRYAIELDGKYYSALDKRPVIAKEGETVAIIVEQNSKGYWNIMAIGKQEQSDSSGETVKVPSFKPADQMADEKAKYWEEKDRHIRFEWAIGQAVQICAAMGRFKDRDWENEILPDIMAIAKDLDDQVVRKK